MRYLLLFLLLLFVVYWLRRSLGRDTDQDAPASPRRDSDPEALESMHACAHCGLVVPRSEGLQAGGQFYCSAEHARAGRAHGGS